MIVFENRKGLAIAVLPGDKELYHVLRSFFQEDDEENVRIFGDTLMDGMLSYFPRISSFEKIDSFALEDMVAFVVHNDEANPQVVQEICSAEGVYINVDIEAFLQAANFHYRFYRVEKLADILDCSFLGGALVKGNGNYYIKSDDLRYLDFFPEGDFLAQYRVVVPDLTKEFNNIQELER